MHIVFSAVIPIALVIIQYSNIGDSRGAVSFRISITGILLLLFVFWIIKKLIVDKKLANLNAQSNVMMADLKTKQNDAEIKALENELRNIRTLEAVFASIIPLLVIAVGIIAFKALEEQLVRLSATLGFIGISYAVGLVFNVLYSREIHAKDKGGSP